MTTRPSQFEVVIAHYNEPLAPFQFCGSNATVYTKSPDPTILKPPPGSRLVPLSNHGRDCHTFLYHIVHNYDRLAERTLFIQGDPFPHLTPGLSLEKAVARAQMTDPNDVQTFHRGVLRTFSHWDGLPWDTNAEMASWLHKETTPMSPADMSPGEFWRHVTGDGATPKVITWVPAATYVAGRDVVRRLPLEAWARALEVFERDPQKSPEVGHYMERFWLALMDERFRVALVDERVRIG